MLNIIIFGAPGAGKGTQADLLAQKFNLVHLSTGEILRNELSNKTSLGLEAEQYMKRGDLVPDDVIIKMIETNIDKHSNHDGFIFDGYPRTIKQADALDELFNKKGMNLNIVLGLEVEEKELIERLMLRGKNSGRVDDQNIEIIHNRVQEYQNKTAPLIEYYKNKNKFRLVAGMGDIKEISERLSKTVEKI